MRPFRALISLEEAMDLAMAQAYPLPRTETVSLDEALSRVCAKDVVSPIQVPPFDRAAMDGYAVRAEDTFGAGKFDPKRLRVLETIHAGSVPQKDVEKGQCSEIATGVMMPSGADAVVMVEDTEREGEEVLIYKPVHPGQNVSPAGEDIETGEIVVREGELITPSKLGAVAAIGLSTVEVYEKPRVAIFTTGEEIVPPGTELKPGQIYDVNSYTLSSVVKLNGGVPVILPKVGDSLEDLERALDEGKKFDLVVFSGGSSVGEKDLIIDAIQREGELLFHGVAVKPGKPTVLGRVGDAPVLGMPGYPTSCLSNALMILVPMIRKMAHLAPPAQQKIELPLSRRVVSTIGRTEFHTVRVINGEAVPAYKESGAITSMAHADGYIIIPSNVDLLEKGEKVEVILF